MAYRTATRSHLSPAFHALWCVLLFAMGASAQPLVVSDLLSTENGLSFPNVTALLRDSQGFLWIGTNDGLNRFDGYEIAPFHALADSTGLADDYVNLQALYEDRDGFIWIGTRNGLSRFDPRSGRFTNYWNVPSDTCSLHDSYVKTIVQVSNDALWIGTRNGLSRFDPATGCFVRFTEHQDPAALTQNTQIQAILVDHRGLVWIGRRNGLALYDASTGEVFSFASRFDGDAPLAHVMATVSIDDLVEDGDGNIWAGSLGHGLFRIDASRKAVRQYLHDPRDPGSLPDDGVMAVHAGRDGKIWVGTYEGGVACYDPGTGRFSRYAPRRGDPRSIADVRATSFAADPTGLLWIGTWRGVNRLSPPPPFRLYTADTTRHAPLSHPEVSAVVQDRSGNFWVGTTFGGLNQIDAATGKVTSFRHDSLQAGSISSDRISAVEIDAQQTVWVATFEGLNRYDPRTGTFSRFRHAPSDPHSPGSDLIYSVYEDRDGAIWIGTISEGLDRFDRKTGRFTHFRHDPDDPTSLSWNMVWPVLEDHAGTIWVGTIGGGLNRFDRATGRFTRFRHDPRDPYSLSHDRVIALAEDAAGHLWVGTMGGGLNRLDRATGRFRRYGVEDGLPHHNAVCLLPDDQGRLWIGTSNGLARLDPQTERFRTFHLADGLQNTNFYFGACTRGRDGTFYFGTYNGLVAFHPDSLRGEPAPPPVVLTGFDLFNQPARLDSSITFKRRIELPHDQNFVGFHFAALAYEAPEAARYAYRLEGVDQDWTYVGDRRYAGYPGLQPGRYVFRVKAANGSGGWNESGASVLLVIRPPYWKTWWFGAILGLTAAGMLWLIHKARVRQVLRFERLRSRIADDLHDDLGSKIGAVAVRLDHLSRQEFLKETEQKQVRQVLSTTLQLSSDLRDTVWLVHAEHDHLTDLVERMRDTAHQILAGRSYSFSAPPEVPAFRLGMERRRHLFLIYKESIHNAVRHADASQIDIEVAYSEENLSFSVIDDGKGYNPEWVRAGRGLRTLRARADAIGARLTIESQPGHGTTVRLSVAI